jgi:hypothetical protein
VGLLILILSYSHTPSCPNVHSPSHPHTLPPLHSNIPTPCSLLAVVGLLSGTSGFEIAPSRVLSLTKAEESFVFNDVKGKIHMKEKKGIIVVKKEEKEEKRRFHNAHLSFFVSLLSYYLVEQYLLHFTSYFAF